MFLWTWQTPWTPLLCQVSVFDRPLTVLHLVPHTTWRWLSHWEANTLLRRPRENSLSLRMPGSLPAAKPRRLRWSRHSCCCWGLNSRPRRAHTTERRLRHHCCAWRDEDDTRLRLYVDWHQPTWREGAVWLATYMKKLSVQVKCGGVLEPNKSSSMPLIKRLERNPCSIIERAMSSQAICLVNCWGSLDTDWCICTIIFLNFLRPWQLAYCTMCSATLPTLRTVAISPSSETQIKGAQLGHRRIMYTNLPIDTEVV